MGRTDNGKKAKAASTRLTEDLKMLIRQEFIEGYLDDGGVRRFPTVEALVKRHGVARATIYRHHKKEDWQSQKDVFHTKWQAEVEANRLQELVQEGQRLDRNSLQIAQAMLGQVANQISKSVERQRQDPTEQGLSPNALNALSQAAATAQKIGKLALGEAQEISKVSADVSEPEAFREVMEQLDELAKARSSRYFETLQ